MMTPRLLLIAENVHREKVADIGTDHAYIPIHLIKNQISCHVIATDIKRGPLSIAKSNIKKNHLSDQIEVRLGSGLAPIKKCEVDTYIIAGMGGEMIKQILQADLEKAQSAAVLLLQPMNAQAELRQWLCENHFSIINEDIAIEGFKVYNLLLVKLGIGYQYQNEFQLHLPPYLKDHPLYSNLKEKKRRELIKIRNGLEKAAIKDKEQIDRYQLLLDELERN